MNQWLFDPWDLDWVSEQVLGPVLDWLGPPWQDGAVSFEQPGRRQLDASSMPIWLQGYEDREPAASAELWLTGLPEIGDLRVWSARDLRFMGTARGMQLAIAELLHDEVCETTLGWGRRPPIPDQIAPPKKPPTHWRPRGLIPDIEPGLTISDQQGHRVHPASESTWNPLTATGAHELSLPARIALPGPPPDLVILEGYRRDNPTWTLPLAATVVGNGTFPIQFTGIDITPELLDELHEDGTAETTEAELTIAWAATDTTAMARWELQWSPNST